MDDWMCDDARGYTGYYFHFISSREETGGYSANDRL